METLLFSSGHHETRRPDEHQMRMRKRGLIFLLCAMMLAVSAVSFAEYSTLRPGDSGEEVRDLKKRLQELRYIKDTADLTKKYTDSTAEKVREFQQMNGLPETGEADEATLALLYSDDAVKKPYPTMPPLAEQAEKPVPDWPERDNEGFLAGEEASYVYENDEAGLWVYLGRKLQIVIARYEDDSIPLVWFETDIRTREDETFRTVQTDPERPGKRFQYPDVIATDAGLVLGLSDDFFAARMNDGETVGIIIREGKIISTDTYRKNGHHLPNLDMMAQYPDGSLQVYTCNEITAEELLEKGAVNVFSFGPMLIRDGEINDLVYRYYRDTEPRHALGMIEPHHYLVLSVQGRNKESKGTNLQRVAEMMQERGVTQALNLDGGNTMALVFRGRMLNKLAVYKNRAFVRTVTSLIGIGYEPEAPQE